MWKTEMKVEITLSLIKQTKEQANGTNYAEHSTDDWQELK